MDKSLSALGATGAPPPPLSPETLKEVQSSTARPLRRPHRQWLIFVSASGSAMLAVLALVGLSSEYDTSLGWFGVNLIACVVGFAVASRVALVPERFKMMPTQLKCIIATLAGAGIAITLGLAAPYFFSSLRDGREESMRFVLEMGAPCFRFGLAAALVPILLGALLLRGSALVNRAWIAATLGVSSGTLALLLLHLHCGLGGSLHLGGAHGGVVLGAVLAALALARLLRPNF